MFFIGFGFKQMRFLFFLDKMLRGQAAIGGEMGKVAARVCKVASNL
jgi:hypothetical protein